MKIKHLILLLILAFSIATASNIYVKNLTTNDTIISTNAETLYAYNTPSAKNLVLMYKTDSFAHSSSNNVYTSQTLYPNANGTSNQWHEYPATTSNYDKVDETTVNYDVDYTYLDTCQQIRFGLLSSTLYLRADTFALFATAGTYYTVHYRFNINPVSGDSWTSTTVNALQLAIKDTIRDKVDEYNLTNLSSFPATGWIDSVTTTAIGKKVISLIGTDSLGSYYDTSFNLTSYNAKCYYHTEDPDSNPSVKIEAQYSPDYTNWITAEIATDSTARSVIWHYYPFTLSPGNAKQIRFIFTGVRETQQAIVSAYYSVGISKQ
jgi:hypothetical protein